MFYESLKVEKNEYERKSTVLTKLKIMNNAYEADKVEVLIDDESMELVVMETSDDTASPCCLLHRVGFYPETRVDFQILFVDEETFLIIPSSGAIFLKAETEDSEIDVATLDIDGSLEGKRVYSSLVRWMEPKYILDLIRGGTMGEAWGLLSDKYPFDYIFYFSAYFSKEGNFSIRCIGFDDISLGMIPKVARSLELKEYRAKMKAFNEMEQAERAEENRRKESKLLQLLQQEDEEGEYFDFEDDDDNDYTPRKARIEDEDSYN